MPWRIAHRSCCRKGLKTVLTQQCPVLPGLPSCAWSTGSRWKTRDTMTASDLTRMIAMLTLLRCDGFSVSPLLPKPGTDRGSGDRHVEEGDPHPSPPAGGSGTGSLLLHYFSMIRVDSRGLRRIPVGSTDADKTLDVERVRPQTTRRQSVTETCSHGSTPTHGCLDRLSGSHSNVESSLRISLSTYRSSCSYGLSSAPGSRLYGSSASPRALVSMMTRWWGMQMSMKPSTIACSASTGP